MKWKPCKDLIAWGNKHLGEMPVGGVWAPDDSGVQYQKMNQTSFVLVFQYNHPLSEEYHEKFTAIMEACGFTVVC